MKILFTRFPLESAYGGAEVQTMSLMNGLLARHHAVAFLGSCPVLLEKCAEEGIPCAKLKIGPPPVTTWVALSFLWRKQRMQRLLENALDQFQRLDAICMLSLSEKILLTPIALARGIPVVWIEHDRVGDWLRRNPWLSILQRLSNDVTTVVVSDLSKKIYIELGWNPDNIIAVPNCIDLQRFASSGHFPYSTTNALNSFPLSPRPLPNFLHSSPHPPTPSSLNSTSPYPPAPSPDGGRGERSLHKKDKENDEVDELLDPARYRKSPVHGGVLEHARDMRRHPTDAEELLWQYLRFDQLGIRIRRQHPLAGKILDFYCHQAKLGIEIDGGIHNSKVQQEKDHNREIELDDEHIHIIRFSNEEVVNDTKKVVSQIKAAIMSSASLLSSSPYPPAPSSLNSTSPHPPAPSPDGGRGDRVMFVKDSPPPPGEGLGVGEKMKTEERLGVGESAGKVLHIGTVARLTQDKGVDLLINAVADMPEVTLTVIGKGREEGFLRKLADQANQPTSQRVKLLPSVADLGAFYNSLDIFVLPSREHDPFGLVAAEAMSLGIPIIVTDACGIAGYLTQDLDALIVPANDAKALRDAVIKLQDPIRRISIGNAARKTAQHQFALHSMIDKYEKLFLEIQV